MDKDLKGLKDFLTTISTPGYTEPDLSPRDLKDAYESIVAIKDTYLSTAPTDDGTNRSYDICDGHVGYTPPVADSFIDMWNFLVVSGNSYTTCSCDTNTNIVCWCDSRTTCNCDCRTACSYVSSSCSCDCRTACSYVSSSCSCKTRFIFCNCRDRCGCNARCGCNCDGRCSCNARCGCNCDSRTGCTCNDRCECNVNLIYS